MHFQYIPSIPLSQKYFENIICQDLILKQNYKTIMQLPHLQKIILNTTSKQFNHDRKNIVPALVALEFISGQKTTSTYAKKSIATFKLRKDQILGCKVTLQGRAMYLFLQKLICIYLPRIRDFKGITLQTELKNQNISLGIENLMVFPELQNHFETFENTRGLHLNMVLTTPRKQDAALLVSCFQIPVKTP